MIHDNLMIICQDISQFVCLCSRTPPAYGWTAWAETLCGLKNYPGKIASQKKFGFALGMEVAAPFRLFVTFAILFRNEICLRTHISRSR